MNKDIHTEHCCLKHGCKYCDDDCSVTTGKLKQSFPCEYCNPAIDKIWELFHKLWGDARAGDYDKKSWMRLQKLLEQHLEN